MDSIRSMKKRWWDFRQTKNRIKNFAEELKPLVSKRLLQGQVIRFQNRYTVILDLINKREFEKTQLEKLDTELEKVRECFTEMGIMDFRPESRMNNIRKSTSADSELQKSNKSNSNKSLNEEVSNPKIKSHITSYGAWQKGSDNEQEHGRNRNQKLATQKPSDRNSDDLAQVHYLRNREDLTVKNEDLSENAGNNRRKRGDFKSHSIKKNEKEQKNTDSDEMRHLGKNQNEKHFGQISSKNIEHDVTVPSSNFYTQNETKRALRLPSEKNQRGTSENSDRPKVTTHTKQDRDTKTSSQIDGKYVNIRVSSSSHSQSTTAQRILAQKTLEESITEKPFEGSQNLPKCTEQGRAALKTEEKIFYDHLLQGETKQAESMNLFKDEKRDQLMSFYDNLDIKSSEKRFKKSETIIQEQQENYNLNVSRFFVDNRVEKSSQCSPKELSELKERKDVVNPTTETMNPKQNEQEFEHSAEISHQEDPVSLYNTNWRNITTIKLEDQQNPYSRSEEGRVFVQKRENAMASSSQYNPTRAIQNKTAFRCENVNDSGSNSLNHSLTNLKMEQGIHYHGINPENVGENKKSNDFENRNEEPQHELEVTTYSKMSQTHRRYHEDENVCQKHREGDKWKYGQYGDKGMGSVEDSNKPNEHIIYMDTTTNVMGATPFSLDHVGGNHNNVSTGARGRARIVDGSRGNSDSVKNQQQYGSTSRQIQGTNEPGEYPQSKSTTYNTNYNVQNRSTFSRNEKNCDYLGSPQQNYDKEIDNHHLQTETNRYQWLEQQKGAQQNYHHRRGNHHSHVEHVEQQKIHQQNYYQRRDIPHLQKEDNRHQDVKQQKIHQQNYHQGKDNHHSQKESSRYQHHLKQEISKHVEMADEAQEQPSLQILDVHQYFRDDFDINSIDKMGDDMSKIKMLKTAARSYDEKVSQFSEEKYSLEYFVLDEKLMRLIEKLDKIRCQNDPEATEKKIRVIEYIKNLHRTLDERAKEEF